MRTKRHRRSAGYLLRDDAGGVATLGGRSFRNGYAQLKPWSPGPPLMLPAPHRGGDPRERPDAPQFLWPTCLSPVHLPIAQAAPAGDDGSQRSGSLPIQAAAERADRAGERELPPSGAGRPYRLKRSEERVYRDTPRPRRSPCEPKATQSRDLTAEQARPCRQDHSRILVTESQFPYTSPMYVHTRRFVGAPVPPGNCQALAHRGTTSKDGWGSTMSNVRHVRHVLRKAVTAFDTKAPFTCNVLFGNIWIEHIFLKFTVSVSNRGQ